MVRCLECLYLFLLKTSTFIPEVEITSPQSVDLISRAPIPQLVFQPLSLIILRIDVSFIRMHPRFNLTRTAYFSSDFLIQRKYKLKLSEHFSIFSTEYLAIIYAVDYILERGIKKATIFIDSRS